MARHHRLENDLQQTENDAFDRDPYHSCSIEGRRVRLVWVTNYTNDEDFPIHVPIEDRLDQIVASPSSARSDSIHSLNAPDLSKLNLNELLLLLYRLQHCSNHSILEQPSPPPSTRHSPISRPHSSFTLSNMAEAPKQLTTTLIRPSINTPRKATIHSPNDVATKLWQSFHLDRHEAHAKPLEHQVRRHSSLMPHCNYHESQQLKARLVSNLLSVSSSHR